MRGRAYGPVGSARRSPTRSIIVKISPLSIGLGISTLALVSGCVDLPNFDDSSCAGYLGCSANKGQIGVAPPVDPCTGKADVVQPINQGCGKQLPASQVFTIPGKPTGYTQFTVMGTGATLANPVPTKAGPRTFWVRVPVDYDPNHKYRVVYIGQGCGGYGVADTMTLQLFKEGTPTMPGGTEEAIYVALDIPMDMANMDCYDNRDGLSSQEWEAFQLFQTFVDSNYCVDNDRVYISGYSTGGWLTNQWGCYFAGDGEHAWNGVPGMVPQSLDVGNTELTSRAGSASGVAGAGGSAAGGSGGSGAAGGATGGSGGASGAGATGGGGGAGAGGSAGAAAGSGGGAAGAAAGTSGGAAGSPGAAGASGGAAGSTGAAGSGSAPAGVQCARKFAPQYHIRAQAGVSGGEPDNNPPCNGPIAAIWIHDLMDSNAYSGNHDVALPRVLKMNGCYSQTPPTAPWHEDIMGKGVCVQYTDCPAAYPVVFCTTNMYGHGDQHERAVPGFTTFFKELETHVTPLPVLP
jgi:poly(3-hydroxybutyrate) depolymerase